MITKYLPLHSAQSNIESCALQHLQLVFDEQKAFLKNNP